MTATTQAEPQQRLRMPKVWRGRRRFLLVTLVVLGVIQAVLALTMALVVDGLLSAVPLTSGTPSVPDPPWAQMVGLAAAVLGIGLARWVERVVAEDLGQDYVYEQRRRLITAALHDIGNRSLGVVVTRASNDLTAVRNWIAQGLVPMLTALPLIAVVLGTLVFINPPVALAVAVPLALTAVLMPFLSRIARERARSLRRFRGRMSARIADSVQAGESIRVAGAVRRELNAVDRDSSKVVNAAVERARITGLIRALTVTAASLSTAAVVYLAVLGIIDVAGVASIMTLLGVMATPMGDLGRVVEYRQNYRAALRILAPIFSSATQLKRAVRNKERAWQNSHTDTPEPGDTAVVVEDLNVDHVAIPALRATPGERILLDSTDPNRVSAVLKAVLLDGLNPLDSKTEHGPAVLVAGYEYGAAPAALRRELVGMASDRLPLERGSVQRLASYRLPKISADEVRWMLHRVGLTAQIVAHPKGVKALLKNDGETWSRSDVARLKIARALLGNPSLVVLENIDAALDEQGLIMLRKLLDEYPGTVLFSSLVPQRLFAESEMRRWPLDG
ncbi:MAG TPA: ABC transporter ATP-binding protein/permease [Candidatus Yaniella excrementavium]|nr:ABC transporter ATP-binding protein/permease [Candidatus Yaniella excrementavium]